MKSILIATHNPAKLEELKSGINIKDVNVISLNDLKITQEPNETGKTFEENAILKAKYYSSLAHLPTIADDAGLIIPILNNEPGIKSRRWLGRESTDRELIDYTLKRLKNYSNEKRLAYLQVCLCFFNPDNNQLITVTEKIKGYIAEKESQKPTNSYPYRALFMVDKYHKYYDELTEVEHKEINHRLKALNQLTKKIILLI